MARGGSKKKGGGQYAPLPYAMLKSAAWRSLSGASVRLLLELHLRFNGSNNGRLRLSYAEAVDALGMGKASVGRAYEDLQDKGFIALAKPGNWYHRQAHEWRLTFKPMQLTKGREPPTNEWRAWRPSNPERGSETEQKQGAVVPFENPRPALGSGIEPVRPSFGRRHGSGTEHL